MTREEKAVLVAEMLLPDVVDDASLLPYIDISGEIILNKRYPFGFPDGTEVPAKYEATQCQIAICLWNQRGAEGQSSHSENGINRTWAELTSSPLLEYITPVVGSVVAK
jgi:hypothetical protein